jgi:hypothetical protein
MSSQPPGQPPNPYAQQAQNPYTPPAQNPYAPQGGAYGAPPGGAYGAPVQNNYGPAYVNPEAPAERFGDAAGEHIYMKRGRYGAWPYVVIAFLGQIAFVGALPGAAAGMAFSAMGMKGDAVASLTMLMIAIFGGVGAFFMYRNRWRCIEAFSSRFCSGLMNLSLMYVPIIAFVYGNVRGVQKLFGK